MSFLAPFYLLAGLAVALPIAFHMIRRTPQGRQVFSSVMFLSPSPPRMTKRSRIEDWMLLILRSLAICLIAFAFARPFFRTQFAIPVESTKAERVGILLDRSASMRRDGYWERALEQLRLQLAELDSRDQVEIHLFDDQLHPILTFEESKTMAQAVPWILIQERIQKIGLSWHRTDAGQALLEAAEGLRGESEEDQWSQRLILISDMQAGAGWDVIQVEDWPDELAMQVIDVSEEGETNASFQVMKQEQQDHSGVLRARVTNVANSTEETFQIGWRDEFSSTDQPAASADNRTGTIQVRPGQTRVINLPAAPKEREASTLILSGDDVPFDNTFYLIPPVVRSIQISYLGPDDEELTPDSLRFFLEPVFPGDVSRTVRIVDWKNAPSPVVEDPKAAHWVIVGGVLSEQQLSWARGFLQDRGNLLFVARSPEQSKTLYSLLSIPEAPVAEAEVTSYAMLGKVDLQHPVLSQFDNPRYSDFTKLRYSKYRKFAPDSLPGLKILAAMEDGSPALAEIPSGEGKVMLLSSGWNRSDSDLAVWSKFVPLMNGLLENAIPQQGVASQLTVGSQLRLFDLELNAETIFVRINGVESSHASSETLTLDEPGVYRFARSATELAGTESVAIAVNLAPEESRTEHYPMELLASAGIRLQEQNRASTSPGQGESTERQLMNQELESRQQWWRWLVVAGLLILFLESLLALRPGKAHSYSSLPT